ncbi:MAG: hypothetical protein HUU15_10070 [Candidatus Brocadiae bacterium]|nr:hypothetical protein [Candidatus Brocadiia bacterium]
MRVMTSGTGQMALWSASKYSPESDLRSAWARLFRFLAWGAAVPSFLLLGYAVFGARALESPTERLVAAWFLNTFVGACGVGITALFASITLARTRKREMAILSGGCGAGVLALYLPELIRCWPALRALSLPMSALVPLLFPFALILLAAAAGLLGRRARAS